MDFITTGEERAKAELPPGHDPRAWSPWAKTYTPKLPPGTRVTIRRVLTRRGPVWCGRATIPTGDGPLVLFACVPEAPIRREAAAELQNRPGWGWGDIVGGIKKIAKKVARARIIKKMAGAVKSVVDNPYVAKAVGLASFAVPALGVSFAAVKAGTKILDMAQGVGANATKAKKAIRIIRAKAKAGNPKFVKAYANLKRAHELRKAGVPPGKLAMPGVARPVAAPAKVAVPGLPTGKYRVIHRIVDPAGRTIAEVGGFLYNVPYRGIALAPGRPVFDALQPFRGLYTQGMTA